MIAAQEYKNSVPANLVVALWFCNWLMRLLESSPANGGQQCS
jgi:hypothetical protein